MTSITPNRPIHARHFASGQPIAIAIQDGRIATVEPSAERPVQWVAPGFCDPQINGCLGISFNSPDLTADHIQTVVDTCRAHGIGAFLPTLITADFESIRHGFGALARAVATCSELQQRIPGYHLEGPYLSAEDGPRGAHPREHIRDPNWDEFQRWQEAAGGAIRMVTVAPERAGAIAFIERLASTGIVVAIGHTAATSEQIRAAVSAGARTSTHLGNGAHAVLPRHPNYMWDQLAEDGLWASIIPDGHHLPPTVVKTIIRAKGLDRVLLTCDASSLAGMSAGRYRAWGADLEVCADGKVMVAGTPYLAGSGHFTDRCVGNVIRFAGVSLADAVEMATTRPRQLLGLPVHTIEPGQPGDLVFFDWEPGGELVVRSVA